MTIDQKVKNFSASELRDLFKPRTWFRTNLVARTEEELSQNIEYQHELEVIAKLTSLANKQYEQGILSPRQYQNVTKYLRRERGNILYK